MCSLCQARTRNGRSSTGELFALLRTQSTLLKAGSIAANAPDASAFDRGVQDAKDGALLHRLFQVRSRQLLEGMTADQATSLLSGLLVGCDVNQARQSLRPEAVTLIGEPVLGSAYARALESSGIPTQRLDGSECALAALRALAEDGPRT
jgi:2-dehydro-3-deoxygalactonokinase